MNAILLSLIAVSTLLTIVGKYRSRGLMLVFKPLTTILILILALDESRVGAQAQYQGLIGLGLLFSLAGDVFLMWPERAFVAGLASFLVAHLIYVVAFTQGLGFNAPVWVALVFGAGGLGGLALMWRGAGALRIPVLCYVAAITAMVIQAVARALSLDTTLACYAALGAVLFMVSDFTLGYNKFVKSFPAAEALLLTTYFAGQALIALSV